MKKGFTLVELLGVITILAILALITVPIVIPLINQSRQNALIDSGYIIVNAAKNYQMTLQETSEPLAYKVVYPNGINSDKLDVKGDLPDAGEVEIDESGKVTLAIWKDNAKACAVKSAEAKEITINENITSASDCTLANINK